MMSPIRSTAPPSRSQLGCLGIEPQLLRHLESQLAADFALTSPSHSEQLFEHMEAGGRPLDAVVLGMAVEGAVRLAQRIHIHDKLLPVMILSPPASTEELKRTLMFSPFLGNEVTVWSIDDVDVLPAALREAAKRYRQRQIHHNTLLTAQIRLEKLPLQRPEATHYLDRLLDHAPVGVITVDIGGTVVTSNRQASNILAGSEREVLGQPLARFFSQGERRRLARLHEICALPERGHGTDVFELGTPGGRPRHVEITTAPLAYRTGQRGFMLILQDVSLRIAAEQERQRAEEDLRQHAQLLRRFHQITSAEPATLEQKMGEVLSLGCEQFRLTVGVLARIEGDELKVLRSHGDDACYPSGRRFLLDQAFCGITVKSSEPLALARAACEQWQNHPAYQVAGHRSYIGTCVQVDHSVHGTLCFFSTRPREQPFNSADSELIKLMSRWIGSELQRERADALKRKLSGALERTADAIMITDRDRYIEYVNPSFENLTGYCRDEVIGHKSYFLRSGLHDKKFYDQLWQVIGKGEVYRGTLVNRKKDGSLYYEQKTISPLKDENGTITHFISAGHDITDLIEAEEKNRAHQAELAHVARLSTLGEMTSGLAHELNQPLCAITTYAQTCLHIIEAGDCAPDRVRYGLEQVVKQAELASAIFRRLRDFSRKGEIRRETISITSVVREVVDFVTAEAHQKLVRLHWNVPPDIDTVMADAIQIEQVLLNLVRNAMDALSSLDSARRQVWINAWNEGQGAVTIEIRDQGCGCPGEMAERLFEPFVTSKPEGLGIGLSISQGIVEAHGGRLWLAENSDNGAAFRFTLPGDTEEHDQRH